MSSSELTNPENSKVKCEILTKDLKKLAKSQIKGNILILFVMTIISSIGHRIYDVGKIISKILSYNDNIFYDIGKFIQHILNSDNDTDSFYDAFLHFADYGIKSSFDLLTSSDNPMKICLIISIVLTILFIPLNVSIKKVYINLSNSIRPTLSTLQYGFKKCWKNSILLFLISNSLLFIFYLLLVIPGIVKSYSYRMSYYIMAENPDISPFDAIKESEKMMKGNKFELFILDLSFLPWLLLGLATFGLAFIYVNPYMSATETNFYLKLKKEKVQKLD